MAVTEPAQHEPDVVENVPRLASYGGYIRETWQRRSLVRVLASRKLKANYEMTLVGFAWWIFEPLSLAMVYFVLFNIISNRGPEFMVLLLSALLPYKWLRQTIIASMNTVSANANLVSDIYFPRALLPMTDLAVGASHFGIALLLMPPLMAVFGFPFTAKMFLLPVIIAIEAVLALGLAYPSAVWGLYFQNLSNFSGNFIRMWFYLSPSLWTLEEIDSGAWYYGLVRANPLTGLFEGYRSVFLGAPLHLVDLAITCAWAIVLFLIGSYYFTRRESQFGKLV
jgi:ABC-type polysaccharide/polyol phosphate export permease